MKKVLLASTALIMSAGFAAADVSVGGDGRMGVQDGFGDDELRFTSRIRISFSASGETDAGLAFGGSIRADNAGGVNLQDADGNNPGDPGFDPGLDFEDLRLTAGGGAAGQAGSVFIEGGFGKLSMGDVDGAAKAAVGHVSGVGLTGLGDRNESTYISNVGGNLPGALYEYSAGDWAVFVSASNPGNLFTGEESDNIAWALGATYSFGAYSVAIGYEDNDSTATHVILGASAAFGDFTLKANYGMADFDAGGDGDQWAVSGDYTFGATTLTAFYNDNEELGGSEAFGLGASYDLGGGAALKAGYVSDETANDDAYDFGISFSF